MKAFVHIINTPWANYVYDINKHSILRINDETVKWLYSDKENGDKPQEVVFLTKLGYFKENPIVEIEHPVTKLINGYLNNNLNSITLQTTMSCNFYCAYCSFSGNGVLDRTHNDIKMTWQTAKSTLDFLINHSRYSQMLDISFYGGEPLLNFDVIKKSVEYLKNNIEGKQFCFHMTTNGYLLSDRIVSFLEQNSFDLLVSFDGPDFVHNKNRKNALNGQGTHKVVYNNLKMIVDKHANYLQNIMLNAVIDPEIDSNIVYDYFNSDEIISRYKRQFSIMDQSKLDLTFASNDKAKKENCFEELLNIFNRSGKITTSVNNNNIYSKYELLGESFKNKYPLPIVFHPRGQCAVGYKKLFVDVKGDFWPCEKISGVSNYLKIGNINTGFDLEKINEILNFGKQKNSKCQNCWAVRLCNICLATLDNTRDISHSFHGPICKETRKEIEEQLLNVIVAAEIKKSAIEI